MEVKTNGWCSVRTVGRVVINGGFIQTPDPPGLRLPPHQKTKPPEGGSVYRMGTPPHTRRK